jgi:hypothetical protein
MPVWSGFPGLHGILRFGCATLLYSEQFIVALEVVDRYPVPLVLFDELGDLSCAVDPSGMVGFDGLQYPDLAGEVARTRLSSVELAKEPTRDSLYVAALNFFNFAACFGSAKIDISSARFVFGLTPRAM